jgi:UDPglucose--hexose-1-phosphate uridylyltransferase
MGNRRLTIHGNTKEHGRPIMSEMRQNKATKHWVIYAPERRKRPKDFQRHEERRELPPHDDTCPFCPRNEDMLPGIITELRLSGDDMWQTRVVPNKYPALTLQENRHRRRDGIYIAMPGFGRHEVIIESPRHNDHIARMSIEQVNSIIDTYHSRYVDLMNQHGNMMTIIFRNHGAQAGTSLLHPHSQLIVAGIVPRHMRAEEEEAQRYFDDWGRCVFCDMLDQELKDGQRIILTTDSFAAFVPYAAEGPFEIWIMPVRHRADFGAISDGEKEDLARVLRQVIAKLYTGLNDPDYNYVIKTAARYKAGEPHVHWYVQIQPRLTTRAGFEIGSGMRINPSLPEDDAAFLREEADDDDQ